MAKFDLWVEKYRPSDISEYVFKNLQMKNTILEWLENSNNKTIPIPHLLFSGVQGTGKTTLARVICNVLHIEKGDILEINASRENKVDVVREKIVNFCSTWPIGTYKIIILDEVDGFTQQAQMILRAEMEKHADTARFILTCNYPNKIIPALHSRVQSFHLDALDMDSFILRIVDILDKENIEFNPEDLNGFINSSFPDLRKCINLLEQHSIQGKLTPLEENISTSFDYLLEAVELFRTNKFTAARKLITSQASIEEYEDIYRYFYKNLDIFGEHEDMQGEAILIIAKGLRNHGLVADPEINLSACLVELSKILK